MQQPKEQVINITPELKRALWEKAKLPPFAIAVDCGSSAMWMVHPVWPVFAMELRNEEDCIGANVYPIDPMDIEARDSVELVLRGVFYHQKEIGSPSTPDGINVGIRLGDGKMPEYLHLSNSLHFGCMWLGAMHTHPPRFITSNDGKTLAPLDLCENLFPHVQQCCKEVERYAGGK